MTVDPDSEEEEESESATPPPPRRRVEHPPVRVQVLPPPALPRETPAYLLSVNPVAPSVRFRRTKGPLGLGSPPAPPLQPKPRLQGNPPYNLHIHVSRSKGGYFEACGTEADSDLWASSTFHALPYVVAVTAEEKDLRDYIRMRPTRDKGKGKAAAGAAEDAARIGDGVKAEERRNGRSASTALAIDSDDEGDVAVPHSQTMPIEHTKITAKAMDDIDDIGEERERSDAPFQLLTGDQRFQSTKAFTSAGVLPYARKSPYTPIPAKPPQPQQLIQEKHEDAKPAAEKEGSKSATPEPTARRTRAQLRPPTPPPVPTFDPVRTAARRIAYMEHGTTIGADVWCTMLEFEEKAAGSDGDGKAGDATDATDASHGPVQSQNGVTAGA